MNTIQRSARFCRDCARHIQRRMLGRSFIGEWGQACILLSKVKWAKTQRCVLSRAAPNITLERDAHCVRAPQCSSLARASKNCEEGVMNEHEQVIGIIRAKNASPIH